jgi:chemotaxis regulatin CheY-phosphate phosphatase CheZ
MSNLLCLSDEEYLVIEDALSANPRGRAFLRMRDQQSRAIAADEVKRVVHNLSSGMRRASPPPEKKGHTHIRILRQELQEMSASIQQTRSEIAALRPDDTGNNRIMAATGELDAIVTATERATSEILNCAEQIQVLVARLPRTEDTSEVCAGIEGQVIEILTACSFQDITGQRTTKVVNVLHYLEKRVNSMIEIWGIDDLKPPPDDNIDTRPDAHLMNGPSSNGVSQDDVDSLLAGVISTVPAKPAADQPVAAPSATIAAPAAAKATASPAPVPVPPPAKAKPAPPAAPATNGAVNGAAVVNQNEIDALFD